MLNPEQEYHVSEIAQRETQRLARLLEWQIGRTPLRADGSMNHLDFHECVREARKSYERGEDVTV